MTTNDENAGTVQPVLRVVRGEPTAEEIAVLTALMSAAGGSDEPPAPPQRGRWNDPAARFGRQLYVGPGGWRAAAR